MSNLEVEIANDLYSMSSRLLGDRIMRKYIEYKGYTYILQVEMKRGEFIPEVFLLKKDVYESCSGYYFLTDMNFGDIVKKIARKIIVNSPKLEERDDKNGNKIL